MLPAPATSFEVRKPIPVEISSRAMVRIEGAWYSVPSRWARLDATAYLGVDGVRITCMGESVTHPPARFWNAPGISGIIVRADADLVSRHRLLESRTRVAKYRYSAAMLRRGAMG